MSFDFVSYIRKRTDGAIYINVPSGVKENVPINSAVKVHVEVILEEQKQEKTSS